MANIKLNNSFEQFNFTVELTFKTSAGPLTTEAL